jgi:hypothetical protein
VIKRFAISGAAFLLALASFALTVEPASAGSAFQPPFQQSDGVGCVSVPFNGATSGFGVAWTFTSSANSYFSNCSSPWSAANNALAVTVERLTFGGPVACYYNLAGGSGTGASAASLSATQLGGSSGPCDNTSWPTGFTRFCVSGSMWHSGTEVSTGVQCFTDY